jgi:mRNA interferase MazF
MKRGEVWTIAGGPYYAGKPRPAVILQNDHYSEIDSVTVCPITSLDTSTPRVRIPVFPDENNGLRAVSWIAADKIVSLPRSKLGVRVGRIDYATLVEIGRALTVFLDLAPNSLRHPSTRRR